MSDEGKHLADTLTDALAAFDGAVATIRRNGNVVSDDLLDSLQASFTRVVTLARTLERVV